MIVPDVLFMTTFALVFYVLGASFTEAYVNYPTWSLIGETEFRRYHQAVSARVVVLIVGPFVASQILTSALLEWRPPVIPIWNIWISLALGLIVAIVSIVFQIPIQRKFDRHGWSLPLLAQLNRQEWLRKVPLVANAALFLWMMARILATHSAIGSGEL